ncbi:MAG TPA: class I SAM-dependent methyltransferase, partial [Candidatus Dormibacteraeota bacterium]|nr:class I SAM-dependent methyltransferase [Candidatus Dormibacteraeota bacterium]
ASGHGRSSSAGVGVISGDLDGVAVAGFAWLTQPVKGSSASPPPRANPIHSSSRRVGLNTAPKAKARWSKPMPARSHGMLRLRMQLTVPTHSTTACVACGGPLGTRAHVLRNGAPITGGEILRCMRCGTHQVVPRPTPDALAALYNEDYFESFKAGRGIVGGNTEASPVLRERLASLERRLGKKGRLLDVGCALGVFVKYAVDQGWDALGLEPSEWAAREGMRRYGITIHVADLAHAPIEPASLDVVHFNHVMEHLIDPVAEMAAARNLLRDGGVLVVEVPQELSYPLSDRVFRALHPDLYLTPPPTVTHHVTFFTVAGLREAARHAGFKVDRAATVRHIKTDESRLPLGVPAKRLLYWTEAVLETAPDIELWATR